MKKFQIIAATALCSFAIVGSMNAQAGLMGQTVYLEGIYTGYGPNSSGASNNIGEIVVGSGIEYEQVIGLYSDGQQVGTALQSWDFGDTSIEFSMEILTGGIDAIAFGPGDFNGMVVTDSLGSIDGFASASVGAIAGDPIYWTDYYGFPQQDPVLSDWLVDQYESVDAASRAEVVNSDVLELNLQGMVWTDPNNASIVFDIQFVPAPGALAVLGLAMVGGARRRRR